MPARRMPIDSRQLKQDFERLGLPAGRPVMLHASLRKSGPFVDGAEGLIEALISYLGPQGTLLMPLGSADEQPFDKDHSPAEADIGALAEVFRRFPGVQVSDHPAARFAALGRQSEALLEPLPLHDYYGPGSALERFSAAGGWVLRLGADADTVTLTHWAEYLAVLPHKRRVTRHYVRADGRQHSIESLDDAAGIVDWPHGDYFAQILIDFMASGQARIGQVGYARAECFAAADFVPFAVRWMQSHLA